MDEEDRNKYEPLFRVEEAGRCVNLIDFTRVCLEIEWMGESVYPGEKQSPTNFKQFAICCQNNVGLVSEHLGCIYKGFTGYF